MKVLTVNNGSFENKVNFIDENNVFLGYDLSQSCCEEADWFISKDLIDEIRPSELAEKIKSQKSFDFDGFVFDTTFQESRWWGCMDGGGVKVFKIVNKSKVYYLYIYNSHNGYYSHGFELKVDDKKILDGYI